MEAVEAEDLSTKESSMEEREVKRGGEALSERDESVAEAGPGGLLNAGREDAFWSFLVGIAFGPWWGPSAFRLVVKCLGIMQLSSKADLQRTEVGEMERRSSGRSDGRKWKTQSLSTCGVEWRF